MEEYNERHRQRSQRTSRRTSDQPAQSVMEHEERSNRSLPPQPVSTVESEFQQSLEHMYWQTKVEMVSALVLADI